MELYILWSNDCNQADLSSVEAAFDDSREENLKCLTKIGQDLVEKNEGILTEYD
jgi:hypothetical protein